jgi:hypothetical protein
VRLVSTSCATEAIEASASPRNPRDATPLQVVERSDLAGRVPLQRQPHLLRCDPSTVVANCQPPETAIVDPDFDAVGARVDRVLQQFLDDRKRDVR